MKNEILNINDMKNLSNSIIKLLILKKKYNLKLSIDACSSFIFKDFPFFPESIQGCTSALYTAYIDWNLNMKPCSFQQNEPSLNLKNNTILGIWNSEEFNQFRELLIKPRFKGCKKCTFFYSCQNGCPIEPNIVFCHSKK
ncbi:MAG: SPASM domain-containing protein [Candidatus Lokiarchaeota archaeon]|nr:SPASM domain-containing protein [Candidatus Lokiarchaeota archaeon]